MQQLRMHKQREWRSVHQAWGERNGQRKSSASMDATLARNEKECAGGMTQRLR
jgi:hypothetical protein